VLPSLPDRQVALEAAKFGFAALLCVLLLWNLVDTTNSKLDAHAKTLDALVGISQAHTIFLKIACLKNAESDGERIACQAASEGRDISR
jgi:hypothetical protein